MIHVTRLEEGIAIYKALGSELRIQIIKLILENGEMNMNEMAAQLGITNGALTSHVKKLEECGIIKIIKKSGGHGNQKLCRVCEDRILVDIKEDEPEDVNVYRTDVRVGHYSNYEVYPTCGLATAERLIGETDDPRYFAHPDRMEAGIIWFTKGYVEYFVPNLLPKGTKADKITFSLEISSEAPGVNDDWPSDISFLLNDVKLGTWRSPGDFGNIRGILTPDWWFSNWNQYGLLKTIVVDKKGTFVDGLKIADVDIGQLHLDYKSTIRFKLLVADDADYIGGLTVFGSSFGNYSQDIKVSIAYSKMSDPA